MVHNFTYNSSECKPSTGQKFEAFAQNRNKFSAGSWKTSSKPASSRRNQLCLRAVLASQTPQRRSRKNSASFVANRTHLPPVRLPSPQFSLFSLSLPFTRLLARQFARQLAYYSFRIHPKSFLIFDVSARWRLGFRAVDPVVGIILKFLSGQDETEMELISHGRCDITDCFLR